MAGTPQLPVKWNERAVDVRGRRVSQRLQAGKTAMVARFAHFSMG
jgi:hypothetical protein